MVHDGKRERERKVPARANDKMIEVLQANDIIRSNKDRLILDPLSKIIYFFFVSFCYSIHFLFCTAVAKSRCTVASISLFFTSMSFFVQMTTMMMMTIIVKVSIEYH